MTIIKADAPTNIFLYLFSYLTETESEEPAETRYQILIFTQKLE